MLPEVVLDKENMYEIIEHKPLSQNGVQLQGYEEDTCREEYMVERGSS